MSTARRLWSWLSRVGSEFLARRHHRHPVVRAIARGAGVFLVAMAGTVLGILLGGSIVTDIGPFHAKFSIVPSFSGGTEVSIPPLGSLELDSHYGPARLRIQLESLDEDKTLSLLNDPNGVVEASDSVVPDLAAGTRLLALHTAGAGLLGALVLSSLVFRSTRRAAASGVISLSLLAASGAIVVASFRPNAIQEPTYKGLLTNAPAIVGDVKRIADQYEEYQEQLQKLVQNVGRIYGTLSTLPVYAADSTTTRVLHISDMHLNPAAWSVVSTVVTQFSIDIVVDTGDITDWGSEPETTYVEAIGNLEVPYVYIRGNHDSATTEAAVASQPNTIVLTGSTATVEGLTFAGIGDPRFTPDKETVDSETDDDELVLNSASVLASVIRLSDTPVDVALFHDPSGARALAFTVPVILSGHTHEREVSRLDGPEGTPTYGRSLLMVEGSTGGAGLRGLEKTDPLALSLSVLYFDEEHTLEAYDDITVGGTGLSEVSLERHIVDPDEPEEGEGSPSSSSSVDQESTPSVAVS